MKVKTVKRYSCDFCPKKSLRAWSMEKHERHCTMNPNRVCRVCALLARWFENRSEIAQPIEKLLAAMPPPDVWEKVPIDEDFAPLLKPLRQLADDCPACIFAALRQYGNSAFWGFNYKDEMKVWLEKVDEVRNDTSSEAYSRQYTALAEML